MIRLNMRYETKLALIRAAIIRSGRDGWAIKKQQSLPSEIERAVVSVDWNLRHDGLRGRKRTHEIGIRIALGAEQREILKLIVGQVMVLILIGTGLRLTLCLRRRDC